MKMNIMMTMMMMNMMISMMNRLMNMMMSMMNMMMTLSQSNPFSQTSSNSPVSRSLTSLRVVMMIMMMTTTTLMMNRMTTTMMMQMIMVMKRIRAKFDFFDNRSDVHISEACLTRWVILEEHKRSHIKPCSIMLDRITGRWGSTKLEQVSQFLYFCPTLKQK